MLIIKCTMYNAKESLKETRKINNCTKHCGTCPMLKIVSELPKDKLELQEIMRGN